MKAQQNNKKTHVPFGIHQKRFGRIFCHPGLDPQGLYVKKPKACDPCIYKPKSIYKAFKVEKNKEPWKCETELEEWCKNLGYRNPKILNEKKWHKTILGPAWHEIKEPTGYEPACKNLSFGRSPQDVQFTKNYTPGPGTYYKSIPYKTPYGPHSFRPTFEREPSCRIKHWSPSWSLGPGQYLVLDPGSLERKSQKKVSLRGPYDIFTGNRYATLKNHFNISRVSATSWPLMLKGCFETYKKSHFGIMHETGRDVPYRGRNALVDSAMCQRRPSDPDMTTYNIVPPKVFKQNVHPFNSTYDKPPGYTRAIIWPAVGRYDLANVRNGIKGNGHRSVFRSKVQRSSGFVLPKPLNSF